MKCASEQYGTTNQPVLVTLFFLPMRLQKTGKVQVLLEVHVQPLASIYCRSPNTLPFPSRCVSGLPGAHSSLSNIPGPRLTIH